MVGVGTDRMSWGGLPFERLESDWTRMFFFMQGLRGVGVGWGWKGLGGEGRVMRCFLLVELELVR
jgi:hypothetical protein